MSCLIFNFTNHSYLRYRCLFLFNIPNDRFTLATLPSATTLIQCNYNNFLNKVFLNYLKLSDFDFKMDLHSIFGHFEKDKYTLFENQMISVRESTLRNSHTRKFVYIIFVK